MKAKLLIVMGTHGGWYELRTIAKGLRCGFAIHLSDTGYKTRSSTKQAARRVAKQLGWTIVEEE